MAIVLSGTTNDILVNGVSVATDAEVNSALAGKANTADVNTALNLKANTADLKEIGVGQTWQYVTASRALGTTYTNSTGKPIFIIVQGHNSGLSFNLQMTINGVMMCSDYRPSGDGNMRFIIANGNTYKAAGFTVLSAWYELR